MEEKNYAEQADGLFKTFLVGYLTISLILTLMFSLLVAPLPSSMGYLIAIITFLTLAVTISVPAAAVLWLFERIGRTLRRIFNWPPYSPTSPTRDIVLNTLIVSVYPWILFRIVSWNPEFIDSLSGWILQEIFFFLFIAFLLWFAIFIGRKVREVILREDFKKKTSFGLKDALAWVPFTILWLASIFINRILELYLTSFK